MKTGTCDGCTVCCTLLAVEEIRKPPQKRCIYIEDITPDSIPQSVERGRCGIYESRPQSCREFECLWLQTQGTDAQMSPKTRPDRCGVMLVPTTHESTIAAHCESPLALDTGLMRKYVTKWLHSGLRIVKICGNNRTLIALEKR